MVQGVTRRVIVIKSPDPRLFEEAFFIVNGDSGPGVTQDELLEQAQQVATSYIRQNLGRRRRRRLPPLVFLLLGALLVGSAWAATLFFL